MSNLIDRQSAIDDLHDKDPSQIWDTADVEVWLNALPSVQPESKRLTNKEWVDFLVEQFDVSRTTAKSMLHAMMRGKGEDNFKKQFNGAKKEVE